jgi:hypothetical protein
MAILPLGALAILVVLIVLFWCDWRLGILMLVGIAAGVLCLGFVRSPGPRPIPAIRLPTAPPPPGADAAQAAAEATAPQPPASPAAPAQPAVKETSP